MKMLPSSGDDFMEIGETGWVPVGQGAFLNKFTGHVIDESGIEYDKDGNIVYDPNDLGE